MLGYCTIVKSTIHSCDRSYIEPIIGIFNIVSTAVDKLDMLNIKKDIQNSRHIRNAIYILIQQRNMKRSIK